MKRKLAFCMILTLFFASGFASRPSNSTSSPTVTLEWMTTFGTPWETTYWNNVTAAYEAETGVRVRMITIDDLYHYLTRIIIYPEEEFPDIVCMPAIWIPEVANWKARTCIGSPGLAIPPEDVQADVKANWSQVTVDGSTYKGIVWGYPAEFMSYAFVYNEKIFNDTITNPTTSPENATFLTNVRDKLNADQPLNYTELADAAILLTKKDPITGEIIKEGFTPLTEGMHEEETLQFMSLLLSNDGQFIDFLAREAKFNATEGNEVMQLYYNLRYKAYDPWRVRYWMGLPEIWERGDSAMMILPEWVGYIRNIMGTNFNYLGVAPVPIGPHGTKSVSAVYNWVNAVTQNAEEEGKAQAAWEFLKWTNEPKPAGYINIPNIGGVPKQDGISITGDFLISKDFIPSRTSDQIDLRLCMDFWKRGFMETGVANGKSDEYFTKSEDVYEQVGSMFEEVVADGANPLERLNASATEVEAMLPMPGDIDINGIVNIIDAVYMIRDIDATPAWGPTWYRGRCDINNDLVVDIFDITVLCVNFGKRGGY